MPIPGIYDENNRRVIAMLRNEPSLLERAADKLHSEKSGISRSRRFIPIGNFSGPDGNQLYVGLKIPKRMNIKCGDLTVLNFSLELAIFEYFSETYGYHVPRFMGGFSSQGANAVLMEDLTQGGQRLLVEGAAYSYEVPALSEIFSSPQDRGGKFSLGFNTDLLRCYVEVHGKSIEGEEAPYLHIALIDLDHILLKEPYKTQLTERAEEFLSEDYLIRV